MGLSAVSTGPVSASLKAFLVNLICNQYAQKIDFSHTFLLSYQRELLRVQPLSFSLGHECYCVIFLFFMGRFMIAPNNKFLSNLRSLSD